MKSILDPKFKYVSSNSTDLRKTFARVRRELKIPEPKPGENHPFHHGVKVLATGTLQEMWELFQAYERML